jgi:prepilin-type processing-associated H-X9-DG protein
MRQINDGTSKVYLCGEKYIPLSDYLTIGDQCSDNDGPYQGFSPSTIRLGASGGIYAPIGKLGAATPLSQNIYPPMQDSALYSIAGFNQSGYAPAGGVWDPFAGIRFGSAHAGGFNMAFCDGSVHSILYEIDPVVHAMLSDRQDGTSFDASEYLGQ